MRSPKCVARIEPVENTTAVVKKTGKRGRKKKNPQPEIEYVQETLANQEEIKPLDLGAH